VEEIIGGTCMYNDAGIHAKIIWHPRKQHIAKSLLCVFICLFVCLFVCFYLFIIYFQGLSKEITGMTESLPNL